MGTHESIIIPAGAMINLANIEDDDPFLAQKPLEAIPQGPVQNGGIPVIIPEIDPDRVFYYHQPEKRATE